MTRAVPDFALRRALLDPRSFAAADAQTLATTISQGRLTRLLAALGATLERENVLSKVPAGAQRHIESALLVHAKQKQDLAYDCESIGAAMAAIGEKLILLKGGAYIASDLPLGRGRLVTDIDIIVPRDRITDAEQALAARGWEQSKLDPYNESYYRKWSHETPALVNPRRSTTLDLHHNILPPTAGPNIDAKLLFEDAQEIKPGIFCLSYKDMLIHSATHLFQEGEFHHGLRDLWDIHQMLRQFPALDPQFWQELIPRARALQLEESLFHGIHYAQLLFDTPIPAEVRAEIREWEKKWRRPLLDFLFIRAFRPNHPACRLPLTGPALDALFVRSHYLRMPLYLLLPHLARKAWMQRAAKKAESLDRT